MNILIVEDDRFSAEDLKSLLDFQGNNCTIANKIDAAYDAIFTNQKNWDLIILDIMMRSGEKIRPTSDKENGEILFEKIRETDKLTPVIIVTAKSSSEIKINADEKTRVLLKPHRSNYILEAYNEIK